MKCAVVSRINFAVVSAKAAGSESFANASLLAISHTTTLTSYGFGRGSNGAVPSLTRRNSFFERRSAKNVLTRCEWSLRKKADQASATANANTSARTEGIGWKKTRYRERTHERQNNSNNNRQISRRLRHRGTMPRLSQATARAISKMKTYCALSPTILVAPP